MVDTSNETIKKLFYEQIKQLTLKTNRVLHHGRLRLFDYQFSDRWL